MEHTPSPRITVFASPVSLLGCRRRQYHPRPRVSGQGRGESFISGTYAMTFTTDNGPGLKVHQWISNSTGMLAAFALLCHAPSPDNICLYPCTTHQHPESRSEPSSYWIHLHKTWAEVDGLVCSSVGLEEFQCFCAFAMGDESSGCYKHGYLIYRRDA